MEIITTHVNADFDAMASMIAAHKLYPKAVMVFPGSQERNLREFFLKSSLASFSFSRIRDIDLGDITRLILVDINIPGRIGPFDAVASRADVELHIYDHHPRTRNDYRGAIEVIEPVGATTTLMVEEIRRRGMEVTPEEASIMALGIYEDTGSLTFASTTPRDLAAVSWLLEHGAHLDIIPTFITREMDAQQVQLLSDLLGSRRTYTIEGIPVSIATASTDYYVGELALIVHKMIDMEDLNVLFVLVRMEDRIILVARSRLPEVDASRVAADLGGGGHPTAASASIRDRTLVQVQETLLATIRRLVIEMVNAGSIMSSPVIEITTTRPITEAGEIMIRFNINSLPVVGRGRGLKGIITRGVVERAILHGLASSPVSDFMLTEFSTVTEDAPLSKVQELIIEKRQRMLPVVRGKRVAGVITRTDLLEAMHEDYKRTLPFEEGLRDEGEGKVRNVLELMKEILDRDTMTILTTAGEVAADMGCRAYVVGGLVRDMLLRNRNTDVDLVVEGDGIQFSRRLARRMGARVRPHHKFKTAVLVFESGFKLDVASARTEYYEFPGAHPMVERGSIKLDLYRRDFSINALAVRLDPDHLGQMVDYFGGQRDLKERTIRILHNLSFIDDPTRMIRAVRFEQKFGFRIGKHTEYLLSGALKKGYLHRAQGPRILGEIMAILRDLEPFRAFERMDEMGILKALHPALSLNARTREVFRQVERIHSWFQLLFSDDEPDVGEIYFNAVILLKKAETRQEILDLFKISDQRKETILDQWTRISDTLRALSRKSDARNSWIASTLEKLTTEDLLTIMSLTRRETSIRYVSLYLSRLRYIKRDLDGKTLRNMGYHTGPRFRDILQAVQDARVDGLVQSLEEEKAWVRETFPV